MPKRNSHPLPHRTNRSSTEDQTIPLDLNDGGPASGGSEGVNKADKPAVTAPWDQPGTMPSQSEQAATDSAHAPIAPPSPVAAQPTKSAIHTAKLKEKGGADFHYEGPAALKERIKRIASCLFVSNRVAHIMVDEEGVRVMERSLKRQGKLP